jgi:D-sedoheptulose 7-phosphate isomerase
MNTASTQFGSYVAALGRAIEGLEITDGDGKAVTPDAAMGRVQQVLRAIPASVNKLMIIGNGGSAGIASHMAIDFAKNGGVRALTFNDASSLTCLGNDLGYDQVFATQVDMHGLPGDLVVAISSSGQSANILRAVEVARARGCVVVTLSGFDRENPLRRKGALNFYVPARVYGLVETAHQVVLHAILDTAMGWTAATADVQPTRPLR